MSRKDMENDIPEEDVAEDQSEIIEDQSEDSSEDENTVEETADETVSLAAENAELREQILRMAAENQNTRKRLVKQQQEAHKYRHQDILKDLAEVIDNFERAIESSTDSRDFDTFHEGILMIEKQFSGMLTERYGLERIGVPGEAYDPTLHEAMMSEESPEVEEETVKQVYQAGYRLLDRILRPAKVVVVKPATSEAVKTDTADEGDE
jgi:molecular chaperone GrpE